MGRIDYRQAVPRCVNIDAFEAGLEKIRDGIEKEQLFQIPDFVNAEFVPLLLCEASQAKHKGFRSLERHNIFLQAAATTASKKTGEIHFDSGKIAVCNHLLPPNSLLLELYQWDGLLALIQEAFELDHVYRSQDKAGPSTTTFSQKAINLAGISTTRATR